MKEIAINKKGMLDMLYTLKITLIRFETEGKDLRYAIKELEKEIKNIENADKKRAIH